jgi:hypothetical protein
VIDELLAYPFATEVVSDLKDSRQDQAAYLVTNGNAALAVNVDEKFTRVMSSLDHAPVAQEVPVNGLLLFLNEPRMNGMDACACRSSDRGSSLLGLYYGAVQMHGPPNYNTSGRFTCRQRTPRQKIKRK